MTHKLTTEWDLDPCNISLHAGVTVPIIGYSKMRTRLRRHGTVWNVGIMVAFSNDGLNPIARVCTVVALLHC